MNKTIVKIQDALELVGFIKSNGTQCRFVGMTIKTPVTKIKVGNPWGAGAKTKNGLYKISRKIGIVNANYVASVERKIKAGLGLDVNYIPGETWYKHLTTTDGKSLPLVVNKNKDNGEYYLQYFPHKSFENAYVNEAGEVVADSLVESWLHAQSERSEYKPAVISVNVAHIKELNASGVVMKAEDLEEAEKSLEEVSVSFSDNSNTQAQSTLVVA